MKHRIAVTAIVALTSASACERNAPAPRVPVAPLQQIPSAPSWGHGPPPGQGVPPGSAPYRRSPARPATVPAWRAGSTLGSALTPFGALILQLPPLPAGWGNLPLPQLPDLLGSLPWPWSPPPGQPPSTETPPGSWPGGWVAFEDEVLRETNARRAAGALCGDTWLEPAPPVQSHPQLRASARGHSHDMAMRDYFEHDTPEGVGPMQRAKAQGYPGRFVGENIAAGQKSPRQVVQAWIDSPGHCLNLMEPRYRHLGVGYYFDDDGDRFGHYWTQNFGG